MYLTNGELTIRNAIATDAEQLALWWNDGAVMAHAGFPNGLGTSAEEIAESLSHDDDTYRRLIIEYHGVSIGEMNYRTVEEGVAAIGIKICDESKQNQGLGKRLLSMMIASLFDKWDYRKIVLDTNVNNHRAQHVYESLGFRKVRVQENAWTDQLGRPQSFIDYEMTPEDFIDFTK